LVDLVIGQRLVAHGDVVVSQDFEDSTFRDAIVPAELVGRGAGAVSSDQLGDGVRGEAPVETAVLNCSVCAGGGAFRCRLDQFDDPVKLVCVAV
jgi:hypothetical protein